MNNNKIVARFCATHMKILAISGRYRYLVTERETQLTNNLLRFVPSTVMALHNCYAQI